MNRHETTRRVLHTIWNQGIEAEALEYVAPDGSRPVVVCTPGEHYKDVRARVDAAGGSANVILAEVRSFRTMIIERVDDEATETSEGVNAEISMGMLAIRMAASRRKQHRFHIAGSNVNAGTGEFAYA